MIGSDFTRQLAGERLTTTEVLYYLPKLILLDIYLSIK